MKSAEPHPERLHLLLYIKALPKSVSVRNHGCNTAHSRCKPTASPCVKPDGLHKCILASALLPTGRAVRPGCLGKVPAAPCGDPTADHSGVSTHPESNPLQFCTQPRGAAPGWIGRKHYAAINTQVVVDHSGSRCRCRLLLWAALLSLPTCGHWALLVTGHGCGGSSSPGGVHVPAPFPDGSSSSSLSESPSSP